MKKFCLIICVVLLASCASSRRMLRVSPFSDGNDILNPNPQRTNLFPLYYKNGNINSALWPLMDWDKKGFAFRPLYNQEGSDYSILFPLSAWDSVSKDGWITSFYWDRDKSFGMFPLFHHGDDFSYYGPFWKEDESFGVFPLFGKWDDGFNVLNYIQDDDSKWFFPFAYHEKGERFWFSEIYDWEKYSEGHSNHRILSLLSQFEFADNKLKSSYFFPLWYQDKSENRKTFVSPLIYSSSTKDSETFHVLPLWYSSSQKDEHMSGLLPLWFTASDKYSYTTLTPLGAFGKDSRDASSFMVTPLFGYGSSKDGNFSIKNLMGPVYIDYKNNKKAFTSYLWPLYVHSKDAHEESWHLAYLFNKSNSRYGNNMPFSLLSLNSWQDEESERNDLYSLLGMFHSSSSTEKGESSKAHRLWPLYSYAEDHSLTDDFYDFFTVMNIDNRESSFELDLLRGLLYNYRVYGDKGQHFRTGSIIGSYESFDDSGKELKYSYRDNEYSILSGYDWRFLFYNYEQSNLLYMKKGFLNKKEKEVLRAFDYGQHVLNSSVKNHKKISSFNQHYRNSKAPKDDHSCLVCQRAQEVLVEHGHECSKSFKSVKKAYQQFLAKNLQKGVGSEHKVPLLFEKKSTPNESEWEFLFGLARYKANSEKHHFSLLKFLYKEDGHGGDVARDIFPFIQVDSGKKSGISFLGHHAIGFLFNWKHDKNKGHHGHFLFIPWG